MDTVSVGQLVAHSRFGFGTVVELTSGAARVDFLIDGVVARKEIVLGSLEPAPDGAVMPVRPQAKVKRSARDWTDDELVVLVAAFHSNEFAAGDDEHSENHALAEAFGRTPAAVDRQWRNVADVVEGKDVLHVGENVVRAVEEYDRNPGAGRERARRVAEANGWRLQSLL